jgi:xanthine dehydrogenase YagS FAD-binding subunit
MRGEIRAGGTDVQARRRAAVSSGPIIDITGLPGLDRMAWADDGSLRIGALVKIAEVGADARVAAAYPGLAAPARTLATPQIRRQGTMGGVLLQRTRCPYFRLPDFDCFKSGGDGCPARGGDVHYGVCFDLGPCAWPHPSSVGVALLAYEARVEVHGRGEVGARELFGDGTDPTRDHSLAPDEVLTAVVMPRPAEGERAAYVRLMSRAWAEWPLVECVARVVVENGAVRTARVAVGAVANVPLRLAAVEEALEGEPAGADAVRAAAWLAAEGARPLPETAYKLDMLRGTVLEALEQALGLEG